MNVRILLFCGLAALSGCSCDEEAVPAQLSTNDIQATHVQADPATYGKENNGTMCDLDGDGVADFVIFQGDTLFWKRSNEGELVPILKVTMAIEAYSLRPSPGGSHVCLYVYDLGHNEYLCENQGNVGGKPVFGPIERSR